MDLRELKKEVNSLPDFSEYLQKFQQNWIKPIRANTNKHLPCLQQLPEEKKQKINNILYAVQKIVKELEPACALNQKLQEYSRYLIELKLTTLNGDKAKADYLTNLLLHDEFVNTPHLIEEIKSLEKNLKSLSYKYHCANNLVQKEAPLDEAVHFLHLPHQEHLQKLLQTAKKQKMLIKNLGEHFVALAKETRKKK